MMTAMICDKKHVQRLSAFALILFEILFLPVALLLVTIPAAAGDDRILILYDSAGPNNQIGREHAILLTNLLGHFNLPVDAKPVSLYTRGEMHLQKATFYIGATYEEWNYYEPGTHLWQNYSDFLTDAAQATAPLIWLNYNLPYLKQMMDQAEEQSFSHRFGFEPAGIRADQFNRVFYKDTELYKGVVPFANPGADLTGCIAEGDGRFACSTELNCLTILDAEKAEVRAWAYSTMTAHPQTPYITQAGRFWFVGDLPFLYLSEEDRYLAFADILHDILEIDHAESHRALVRLEDVGSTSDVRDLAEVADYLSTRGIPFAVATIPCFRNEGVRVRPLWRSSTGRYLRYLQNCSRVSIVAHGLTHQRDGWLNPYNEVSGDDFEFYRVVLNEDNSLSFLSPFYPDTQIANLDRMRQATGLLRQAGLFPFAWEAPHYLASVNGYLGIRRIFPIHYGRLTYFNDGSGQTRPIGFGRGHRTCYLGLRPRMLGQFFPYPIHRDIYGYRVIPENIGNIEPDPFEGYRPLFPEDLIRHAAKALVVRDGYASFFYHPDLGAGYLRQIVEGLRELGYDFIPPDRVFYPCPRH